VVPTCRQAARGSALGFSIRRCSPSTGDAGYTSRNGCWEAGGVAVPWLQEHADDSELGVEAVATVPNRGRTGPKPFDGWPKRASCGKQSQRPLPQYASAAGACTHTEGAQVDGGRSREDYDVLAPRARDDDDRGSLCLPRNGRWRVSASHFAQSRATPADWRTLSCQGK
jgi:hypothetical protein